MNKLNVTFTLRDDADAAKALQHVTDFLVKCPAVVGLPDTSVEYHPGLDSWEVRDVLGNIVGSAVIS